LKKETSLQNNITDPRGTIIFTFDKLEVEEAERAFKQLHLGDEEQEIWEDRVCSSFYHVCRQPITYVRKDKVLLLLIRYKLVNCSMGEYYAYPEARLEAIAKDFALLVEALETMFSALDS
jgi:hypothetical protein